LPSHPLAIPPAPEITSYVDVGLASISRNLEKLSAQPMPLAEPSGEHPPELDKQMNYAAIFVARSGQSSAFHCHFPQMVAVASNKQQLEVPIRLVGFSKPCADRLSLCLGLPRVSSIGISNLAPNSSALISFVREHVPPVRMAWANQLRDAEFRQTNIEALETTAGVKKQKSKNIV
jgi:ribonuclease P/MRP protein subunit POP3